MKKEADMRRVVEVITGVFVTVFFLSVLTAGVTWAEKEKFELSFLGPYADKHPTVVNGFIPWMKMLEKRSGGRLKIRNFNPGTLCPQREMPGCMEAGTVDIGGAFNGLNPGKFPLNELMELPFLVPSAEVGSLVVWDLYQRFPAWRDEFKLVKMLWQWSSATFQLHTTKKLVKTRGDLKGMKVLGFSPRILDVVKTLGASPVQIKPMEAYLALERGMADGILLPLAPVKSFKITDAAKYHTIVDAMVGAFWVGVNWDLWRRLPKDLQELLVETTKGKMAKISGTTLDAGARGDAEWMKSQGHKFHVLTPAEKKRWVDAIRPIHKAWLKKMEAKGYKNIREIYDTAVTLSKKYAKTTGRGYE